MKGDSSLILDNDNVLVANEVVKYILGWGVFIPGVVTPYQ